MQSLEHGLGSLRHGVASFTPRFHRLHSFILDHLAFQNSCFKNSKTVLWNFWVETTDVWSHKTFISHVLPQSHGWTLAKLLCHGRLLLGSQKTERSWMNKDYNADLVSKKATLQIWGSYCTDMTGGNRWNQRGVNEATWLKQWEEAWSPWQRILLFSYRGWRTCCLGTQLLYCIDHTGNSNNSKKKKQ